MLNHMRVTGQRYAYFGLNGQELPPGELGHAGLVMEIEGVPIVIGPENCKLVAYGFNLVSVPELAEERPELVPPIDFPGSAEQGLDPQRLQGFTDDPVVYCLARDFCASVAGLAVDPEAFVPGPVPGPAPVIEELRR
jgi:hypothetical protein